MKPITPLRGSGAFKSRSALLRHSNGMKQANNQNSKAQKKEIKPSDIYDLKVKTTKIEQEVRLLKTQLSRTKDRINQQNKAITKTKHQANSFTPQKSKTTIKNLENSISSASNTLSALDEQIDRIEMDDKSAYLDELHEEILINYAEYVRVQETLKDRSNESKRFDKMLSQADARASSPYIQEQENALSAIQEENNKLIGKIKAYQNKCQKTKNEHLINKMESEKESLECALQEVDDANQRHTEKRDKYENLSHSEHDEYALAVDELQQLIMYQRKIISDYLQGKELPDPQDRPKFVPTQPKQENEEENENKQDADTNEGMEVIVDDDNDENVQNNDEKTEIQNAEEKDNQNAPVSIPTTESNEEIVADTIEDTTEDKPITETTNNDNVSAPKKDDDSEEIIDDDEDVEIVEDDE